MAMWEFPGATAAVHQKMPHSTTIITEAKVVAHSAKFMHSNVKLS